MVVHFPCVAKLRDHQVVILFATYDSYFLITVRVNHVPDTAWISFVTYSSVGWKDIACLTMPFVLPLSGDLLWCGHERKVIPSLSDSQVDPAKRSLFLLPTRYPGRLVFTLCPRTRGPS